MIRICYFRLISIALSIILFRCGIKIEMIFAKSWHWVIIIGDIFENSYNSILHIILTILLFTTIKRSTMSFYCSKFRSYHIVMKIFGCQFLRSLTFFLYALHMHYKTELMSLKVYYFRDVNTLDVMDCRLLV